MKIIDTHTHICDPVFDGDRSEVIAKAKEAGIGIIVSVSETLGDARKNLRLCDKHPELRAAAGLYPAHIDSADAEKMIVFIREFRDRCVAIGEVGLDFWIAKGESERERQIENFRKFIALASEIDLPLNIHSRSAGRQVVSELLNCNASRVQLHAFDGKASNAMPAVEAGYYFSIPPSIGRSRQKQNLVKRLPLSCLLVETDSPVLGPLPGTRNEPFNCRLVIDSIAEIKGISRQSVAETTYQNTLALYGERII